MARLRLGGVCYDVEHFLQSGKVASLANAGKGDWANCIRVFEYDDYAVRDYSQESLPLAILIALVDMPRGTQARATPTC